MKHIDDALKNNKLKPKFFCELCGIDPRNATKIKPFAIFDETGKLFLVRETVKSLIQNNKFSKSNLLSVSRLLNEDKKPSKKEKTTPKKVQKKEKPTPKKVLKEKKESIVDEQDEYIVFWRRYFEETFYNNKAELSTISDAISQAGEDVVSVSSDSNVYTRQTAAKTLETLNKLQKDRKLLVPQDCANFMIGSAVEYLIVGFVDLMQSEITKYGGDVADIVSVKNKLSVLVNNSRGHVDGLIDEWDKSIKGR